MGGSSKSNSTEHGLEFHSLYWLGYVHAVLTIVMCLITQKFLAATAALSALFPKTPHLLLLIIERALNELARRDGDNDLVGGSEGVEGQPGKGGWTIYEDVLVVRLHLLQFTLQARLTVVFGCG